MCSDSGKMLNHLHGNMEKIRLLTQQISAHSSSVASFLSQGEAQEVVQYLPVKFALLKDITEKAGRLSR